MGIWSKSPVRALAASLIAGVGGTAAMTATTAVEKRLRPGLDHVVDYDASRHVAIAVGAVLRRPPRTRRERHAYFLLAHWGYGSAVGLGYTALRRAVPDDARAAALFYVGCQTMAFTLFPTIGGTRPPWRWRRDIVLSSLAQHAVYVATVTALNRLAVPETTVRGQQVTVRGHQVSMRGQ